MKYKVLYTLIIVLFAIHHNGHAQKVSLILFPSASTEIEAHDLQTEKTSLPEPSFSGCPEEFIQITPIKSERKSSSVIKKHRPFQVIGSIYMKKWSKGLIKLYRLPAASALTL